MFVACDFQHTSWGDIIVERYMHDQRGGGGGGKAYV